MKTEYTKSLIEKCLLIDITCLKQGGYFQYKEIIRQQLHWSKWLRLNH